MIRKLLRSVFSRNSYPLIIPFKTHGISREQISSCACSVTKTLQNHKFVAFVVGGAVRDLLVGKNPKDFDVATDAKPEQVKVLFRRSRIIGRRFKLVHVMCGDELVEVSTFRGSHSDAEDQAGNTDEHGRILRDNVFGNQEQDAERRDLTINALFYDPQTQEIWDFQNGYADLQARRIRMIGNPEQRYREDPVRMLRAIRLAATLGMEIESATREPIKNLASLLQNVPPARLFDEMLKLLLSGNAADGVIRLRKEGLHHGLLPMLDVILEQASGERFVMAALHKTDERIKQEKSVSPAFLFATLLWHEVLAAWNAIQKQGVKPVPALYEAMDQVIQQQSEKLAIPRRYSVPMKELWVLQQRFANRSGRRPYRLLDHPRFRAGWDFLMLRCMSGESDSSLGEWWEKFQQASEEERALMLVDEKKPTRRRTRKRKPESTTNAPELDPQAKTE